MERMSAGRGESVKNLLRGLRQGAVNGILLVAAGNAALLIAKALTWLVVPRILGVVEYGYYKTFTLYLVYVMLLHFGFPDGILLIYGGQNYGRINQMEFRINTRFFTVFQIIVSAFIIGISLCLCQGMRCFIFCMIGLDGLFVNLATYYKFISQAVMRFKEYTLRNVMQAVMQIGVVVIIIFLKKLDVLEPNGAFYILCIVLIDAMLLVWYMKTYSDITFGRVGSVKRQFSKIKKIFMKGILLTISFQVAHLVFFLDSQMVEMLFDVETYSLYAFAYSIANMITVVVSAIATVMFPSLKRLKIEDAVSKFPALMATISVIVFFLLASYFPLSAFIRWFLPDYAAALDYLQIIMPGLALTSCINMIIFTYYKVLNRLKQYLYIALAMLLTGGILNGAGYILFREPMAFSIASIMTLLIWYICSAAYLFQNFHMKWVKNFAYVFLEMMIFYTLDRVLDGGWKSMFTYFFSFMAVTIFIYKRDIGYLLNRFRK